MKSSIDGVVIKQVHTNCSLYTEHRAFSFSTNLPVHMLECEDLLIPGLYTCQPREAEKQVTSVVVQKVLRYSSNFRHKLIERMRTVKLCLSSAIAKASLLLRCGDVEENPGPLEKLGINSTVITVTMYFSHREEYRLQL